MKKPWIGLLDCNNFFVSCERLFRPDLIGKPVVVLSGNDGCVVARSQEVKDIGVPMGVPYFHIKDIVKKACITTFSSHFALYRDISKRVFEVMREELDLIDQYSIDEAFFQIDHKPEEIAWRVKKAVEKNVGIPVSVGIASTKTQAKYANSLAKKGTGVHLLDAESWQLITPDILLRKIWGVGGKMDLQYSQHGLTTVSELMTADTARIAKIFGVVGVRLQQELVGIPVLKLGQKMQPQKSIMSSRSFRDLVLDIEVLADSVAYHVRHSLADLRAMNMKTSKVSVSIRPSRHGDFFLRGGTKEAILTSPSNDTIEILKVAHDLLEQLYESGVPYKKAGITLSQFTLVEGEQSTLFPDEISNNSQAIMSMIDILNAKAGREAVLLGSRLRTVNWQSRSEAGSPAYTTRWSDLASVKAE
jgi:DNA polymerase V